MFRHLVFWLGLLVLLPRLTLAEPVSFATQDITFQSAGVALAGTVFLPEHPQVGVVLVHGSGQEPRMVRFATLLAGRGIAVLTYDKRGVGQSAGVYVGPEVGTNNLDASNLVALAGDANAAVTALSAQAAVPIGLVGFSQAGWVIPIAAEHNRSVNFMVLFSGPVLTTREQLRFQFLTQGKADFWRTHSQADVRQHIAQDPDRYPFVDTDPRAALAKVSTPGLWLLGGKDLQTPAFMAIERLDAMNAKGKAFEYRLYPELGHNVSPGGAGQSVEDAVQWIKAVTVAR
ncbi:alpha/beta hydrolase family protein [Pseudomonas sp. D47]|uniref:alpha/beta hydrolase family protein n=1 Tax=Pseudomonas sp. D47 TaxID=3159447 RepID=UPI00387B76E1